MHATKAPKLTWWGWYHRAKYCFFFRNLFRCNHTSLCSSSQHAVDTVDGSEIQKNKRKDTVPKPVVCGIHNQTQLVRPHLWANLVIGDHIDQHLLETFLRKKKKRPVTVQVFLPFTQPPFNVSTSQNPVTVVPSRFFASQDRRHWNARPCVRMSWLGISQETQLPNLILTCFCIGIPPMDY